MAFEGSLEARLAIRELNDEYGDAVMRRDEAAWLRTWADNAVWSMRGREIIGKPAIGETWRRAMERFRNVGFFASLRAVRVDGDRALARVHILEIQTDLEGATRLQLGEYEDELVAVGGRWLFLKRSFTRLSADPPAP
jgi:uncharacterized protein (TIGR02246 family)